MKDRAMKCRVWDGNKMWYPFTGSLPGRTKEHVEVVFDWKGVRTHKRNTTVKMANGGTRLGDQLDVEANVLWYTGLTDAEGEEIWEGDVLKIAYEETNYGGILPAIKTKCAEVLFEDALFRIMGGPSLQQVFVESEKMIVAGNRFENPELLNQ